MLAGSCKRRNVIAISFVAMPRLDPSQTFFAGGVLDHYTIVLCHAGPASDRIALLHHAFLTAPVGATTFF
jgi:hypothetical protein